MVPEALLQDLTESQSRTARVVASALQSWAEQFPADDLRTAITELEQKRREIDEQLDVFKSVLTAMEDVRAKATGNGHGRPVSKRAAILALLGERPDEEHKLSEIRAALIARSVMPDTERAAHTLQMTLQNMLTRYGEVERPRPGFYKLAPERRDQDSTTIGPPARREDGS